MSKGSDYSSLSTLKVEVEKNIANVIFNRPQAMNTYDLIMSQELPECIESLAEDKSIKLIILKGANGIFMAGGDISFLKNACHDNQEQTRAAIRSLNETIMSIQTMDKLVIAAVEGACAGAGLSIMLACDFAFCATDTKFNTAYSALGLTPDGGMSYNLPKLVGARKAMELIMLAEPFWSDDAFNLGLVNKVLAKEHFENQIHQIATELAKRPSKTVANLKALIRASFQNDMQEQLALELESFVECTKTNDFKLGIQAFLNKTKAEFE